MGVAILTSRRCDAIIAGQQWMVVPRMKRLDAGTALNADEVRFHCIGVISVLVTGRGGCAGDGADRHYMRQIGLRHPGYVATCLNNPTFKARTAAVRSDCERWYIEAESIVTSNGKTNGVSSVKPQLAQWLRHTPREPPPLTARDKCGTPHTPAGRRAKYDLSFLRCIKSLLDNIAPPSRMDGDGVRQRI